MLRGQRMQATRGWQADKQQPATHGAAGDRRLQHQFVQGVPVVQCPTTVHAARALRLTTAACTLRPTQDPVTGDVIAERRKIAARYLQVCAGSHPSPPPSLGLRAAARVAGACYCRAACMTLANTLAVQRTTSYLCPPVTQGWFIIDLLATFPADYIVRAVEGTWMCSLRGTCSWTATASAGSGVSAIRMIRVVRVFRSG